MTQEEIKKSIGNCGLVCALCSYSKSCAGCRCKSDDCDVKACCGEKGLSYCFECKDYPCNRSIHSGMRLGAFNTVAKAEGLDKLAEYLNTNFSRGITYHREDNLTGDYDRCKTADEVIELLKNGKPNPYIKCPEYESKRFRLRLIMPEDAADLFLCYSNPLAQAFFNSDLCTSNFCYSNLDEMKACIDDWINAYKNKYYVRFSIIDKQKEKAVGTVEIFGRYEGQDHSVLRIDIHPEYEHKEYLGELLSIADSFFYDFDCLKIVSKAIPEATERISALMNHGYSSYPVNTKWEREAYYIKIRTS